MKFAILAIGRLKSGPEREMMEDYRARAEALGRKVGISKVEILDAPESNRDGEADWLLSKCPAGAFQILLDERGKSLGSRDFAAVLRKTIDSGVPAVTFLIGGPDGHGARALEAADLRLSFGAMTWPHRLCRIMLMEQIYRAVTIMVNHPYHRP